ncbi:unnamed protein product [Arctia plantaginis]|uniref:RNA helicase n=1 Tax=Arctia plantaginis TaxID=874455 RepID=A0A8S1AUE1_ARCPL|nr:unnamed protein product [Arctia plantaginis]CAB3248870.1 unnamed protein product [Arctia plantaginis]
MACKICSEKSVGAAHEISVKHLNNLAFQEYWSNKSKLVGNRKGIIVSCDVQSSFGSFKNCVAAKVKISAKPNEMVTFKFTILNESKKEEIEVISAGILHTKYKFCLINQDLDGSNPQILLPKNKLLQNLNVTFGSPNIGQYETPIVFHFLKRNTNEKITIIRDMVVFVEQNKAVHEKMISPYACKEVKANVLLRSPGAEKSKGLFLVPKNNKTIYLSGLQVNERHDEQTKILTSDIRKVFETGVTQENYEKFFHNLLWYEESVVRVNVKKYNMSGVNLRQVGKVYELRVPGLAEKRPSLMIGDSMFVRPHDTEEVMFEALIIEINEEKALIGKFDPSFSSFYSNVAKFDIRFFTSRLPLERMHVAVHNTTGQGLVQRIFPNIRSDMQYTKPTLEFYNTLVSENHEQRIAVEHIVAGTSGTAPYLLHGPPGTGKTVTIVEAILQLVNKNPRNRILVCTDSNMAADHVATMLIKYSHLFAQEKLLLRANSKFRVWETLPECLKEYSNGTNRDDFKPVSIEEFMSYNIVITTLSHSAKFGRQLSTRKKQRPVTHLFIDEAAQASEPACLIPAGGLLAPSGQLVLAGDPHQLGPVIISHAARDIGLGISLMERLKNTCPIYNMENYNPNYTVMLRNNFRSDKEIIDIPDKLFYKGQLRALAKKDNLSNVDILGERSHSHATVFYGILSKEQKNGKSPSFFNNMECEIVKLYVQALVKKHKVLLEDIGIVTPYIRQVYTINKMLRELRYEKIEVGTVEAFQGKEKRVIIISTVRANCSLLDYDAKFQLGFLVDDKRFNVAITRAKAKVIVIGNPLCLEKDVKWRAYIQKCRDLGTYHGFDIEQFENRNDIVSNIRPLLAQVKISEQSGPKK